MAEVLKEAGILSCIYVLHTGLVNVSIHCILYTCQNSQAVKKFGGFQNILSVRWYIAKKQLQ